MGILGAGACFARVLCPICVTAIYSTHGPMATFAFMTGMMSLVLILLLTSYRRLIPYRYEDVQEPIPYLITWIGIVREKWDWNESLNKWIVIFNSIFVRWIVSIKAQMIDNRSFNQRRVFSV